MTKWLGVMKCDICKERNSEFFVDGATVFGPWALMCKDCFMDYGKGLGVGRGQKYDPETAEKLEG